MASGRFKIRKAVWLPTVLAIYMVVISVYFAKDWILSGHAIRFFLTVVAEIAIIVLLSIFLIKREKF